MFKSKADRALSASQTSAKKQKYAPYEKQTENPVSFPEFVAQSREEKEFTLGVVATLKEFNPSPDTSEYTTTCKDGSVKFRCQVVIGSPPKVDPKEAAVAKKGSKKNADLEEIARSIALVIWSPNADRLIRVSAQEFIDKEKSNPEGMEALFEAMDFETPYTFVIKKIHNKEYEKYEMKIVHFEQANI
jgi:hypothetical protein